MNYTDENFNPSTLRVVDLRKLLTQFDIQWTTKDRKADLIKLFNSKLVPKLTEKNNNIEDTSNTLVRVKSEPIDDPKDLIPIPIPENKPRNTTTRNNDEKLWKSLILPPSDNSNNIDNNDDNDDENSLDNLHPTEGLVIGQKRKHDDISMTNDDTTYSNVLQKRIKRKRLPSISESKKPIKIKNTNLFDRNSELKLDSTFEKTDNDNDIDHQRQHQVTNTVNYSPPDDHKYQYKQPSTNPIANSTFNEDNDILNHINDTNDTIITHRDEPSVSPPPVSPLPPPQVLTGPINNITVEKDIKVKLEQINSLRNEIKDDIKLITNGNTTTNELESTENINSSTTFSTSLNNITFEDDSELLTKLQNEFQIENSRIEIESDKELNKLNNYEKFKYYKFQYLKIIFIWLTVLLLSFIFLIYRQERIQVGFCGHERETPPNLLKNLLNLHLKCINCPPHAICSENSKIECLPDYTLTKGFFYVSSLIPTYATCKLDSTKIKRINKIVKSVADYLSERNGTYKCGEGSDEEVGLKWDQIIEIINQKLLIDINDENYDYFWNKVKLVLTTRTDIKFNNELIRSISMNKVPFKCRIKKFIITILLKYKLYILTITSLLTFISYIFYKINEIQRQNECYRYIVKDSITKLQQQRKNVTNGVKYIAKIQLRDFYLPQLHTLPRNSRQKVWAKAVRTIEKNSNVLVEDVEIQGEMVRVWTWSGVY
ncbi:Src1 protein [Pichia kluyveri]|uniref:Src1 protein n=1 Tax=Pichia kluyveri TaxID=36015 RepID=A0AAV5R4X4_PICKL|nr:Src1 protein [Pichia kluyveri]